MPADSLPVLIAGGGIGGLAAALGLAQKGIRSILLEKAAALTKKALESEDLKAKFLDLSATAIWRSPADTLAYRDSEEARLAPIIKASGARVD